MSPRAWANSKFKVLATIPGGLWSGLTLDAKGNLYGVTSGGGDYGEGSVFEVSRAMHGKWTVTTLHSFDGDDGAEPQGELIFDAAGNLYGVTNGGGAYHQGTIFELSPGSGGWTLNLLYSFCEQYGCPDGGSPAAGLVRDKDGNLFGTAGGGAYGLGVFFELTNGRNGWTESVPYTFGSRPHDGTASYASLALGKSGSLYGTSRSGGRGGYGTVFELNPTSDGWKEKLLFQFDLADGAGPEATPAFDESGNLYGTTPGGGAACDEGFCGTLFKLSRRSRGEWARNELHGFKNPQGGFEPITGVAFDRSGDIYGTTATGGTGQCYDGCGVVYKLAPRTGGKWAYAVLYDFDGSYETPPDGRLILDPRGNLYGTALSVVYEVTP
jgi:uncharacterized repeat protein (TIGR03803 family)